jgi:hypothetical protein
MKIRRYIAILASLLAVSLFSYPALAQEAGPRAVTSKTSENLGRVPTDTTIQHTFTLKNEGTAPLRISNVQLSGRGLKARLPQEIPPGESGEIAFTADVENLIGEWEWRISFQTNDRAKSAVKYTLQANVFPPIEVAPARAAFFSLFDDESATNRLTILNHTERPLAIERIEKAGEHFAAALGTIEAGKEFALDITVPKSVPPGRYREGLVVYTNSPIRPAIRIPVNVLVKTDIFVFPETVGFGQVDQQQIQNSAALLQLLTQTHTITHRSREFAITGVETDISSLTIATAPRGRAKVFNLEVKLDPARLTPGPVNGSIKIRTDDPRIPEIIVPVTGLIR